MAKLELDIRARLAFLSGAEERSKEALGRPMTVDELRRAAAHYPGDPLPAEVARTWRRLEPDHELVEDEVRARNEERIYQARRAEIVARLTTPYGTERAEAAVTAWEAEARRRGIERRTPEFWGECDRWVVEAARHRRGC